MKRQYRIDTHREVTNGRGVVTLCDQTLLVNIRIYREILTFVDQFTSLRFTATGAPPAAGRIRILPMNQYA
jgi:hypothetical protein